MVSNVLFGFGEGAPYGSDTYLMAAYSEFDVPEPDTKLMVITGLALVAISAGARAWLRART